MSRIMLKRSSPQEGLLEHMWQQDTWQQDDAHESMSADSSAAAAPAESKQQWHECHDIGSLSQEMTAQN